MHFPELPNNNLPRVGEHIVDLPMLQWGAVRPHEFDQIHLSYDPTIRSSGEPNSASRRIEYASRSIDVEGGAYVFVGIHEVKPGPGHHESLQFAVGSGDSAVELSLTIESGPEDCLQTSADLERLDGGGKLPRGLARMLYQSLFPYLQHLADTRHKKVIDIVDRYPSKGITSEDWDRMFIPILNQQGYHRSSNHQFRRDYEPRADTHE